MGRASYYGNRKLFGVNRLRVKLANFVAFPRRESDWSYNVGGELCMKDRIWKVSIHISLPSLLSHCVFRELLWVDRLRKGFDDLRFLGLRPKHCHKGKNQKDYWEKWFHLPRKSLSTIFWAIRSEVKFLAWGEGPESSLCEGLVHAARAKKVIIRLKISPTHQGTPIKPKAPQRAI